MRADNSYKTRTAQSENGVATTTDGSRQQKSTTTGHSTEKGRKIRKEEAFKRYKEAQITKTTPTPPKPTLK